MEGSQRASMGWLIRTSADISASGLFSNNVFKPNPDANGLGSSPSNYTTLNVFENTKADVKPCCAQSN